MKFLIYLEMANNHRCEIMAALARTIINSGHEVHLICESKIAFRFGNDPRIHVEDNAERICHHLKGLDRSLVTVVDVFAGDTEPALAKAERNRAAILTSRLCGDDPPDRLILWSGNFHYQEALVRTAKQMGYADRTLYAEVAWFTQRDRIYLDTNRVNAFSALRGAAFPPLRNEQAELLDLWISRYLSERIEENRPTVEPKTIFVPLQIDTDTSLVIGSPFESMQSFIRYLEHWVPEDWSVTFKAHPKARYAYPLTSSRKNFRFLSSGNLYDFIARAEMIVGINTTVLIESLLFGKKIVAFGQGIFNGNGLVAELTPEDEFTSEISIDQERRDAFLYSLVFDRQLDLTKLKAGDGAHLLTRFPFNTFDDAFQSNTSSAAGKTPDLTQDSERDALRRRILTMNACLGKSMIKIGKSKIASTASIDVERGGVVTIGDDCEVRHHAVLETTGRYNGTIEIGNHCVVGIGNWMQGSGRISIGNDVIIGPYVNIVSTNHMYEDSSIPVAQQPLQTGEVVIEDDVWIGAHCTIATNVRIGAHSIIGANSFVNKDVPPYSVVAGSPAKLIRKRL